MDLDALLDSGEPEHVPDSVGWAVTKVLVLTTAVTAVGGLMLALLLYLVSIGVLTAWVSWWRDFA